MILYLQLNVPPVLLFCSSIYNVDFDFVFIFPRCIVTVSIELEVSQETISAYEIGKYFPSVKSLIKLRKIFGVPIDYILGLSEHKYDCVQVSDLDEEEIHLLHLYRSLDSNGKERILSYLEGYLAASNK